MLPLWGTSCMWGQSPIYGVLSVANCAMLCSDTVLMIAVTMNIEEILMYGVRLERLYIVPNVIVRHMMMI